MQAEHRHHRVADELLDLAAVLLDDAPPAGEVGVDDRRGCPRGRGRRRQDGEVDQVGEEDGDEPALLHLARGQRLPALAHRGQGDVDDVVAEDGALLLERGDGAVERARSSAADVVSIVAERRPHRCQDRAEPVRTSLPGNTFPATLGVTEGAHMKTPRIALVITAVGMALASYAVAARAERGGGCRDMPG